MIPSTGHYSVPIFLAVSWADVGGVIACYKLVCYCHTRPGQADCTHHPRTAATTDNVQCRTQIRKGINKCRTVQTDNMTQYYYLNTLIMRPSRDISWQEIYFCFLRSQLWWPADPPRWPRGWTLHSETLCTLCTLSHLVTQTRVSGEGD